MYPVAIVLCECVCVSARACVCVCVCVEEAQGPLPHLGVNRLMRCSENRLNDVYTGRPARHPSHSLLPLPLPTPTTPSHTSPGHLLPKIVVKPPAGTFRILHAIVQHAQDKPSAPSSTFRSAEHIAITATCITGTLPLRQENTQVEDYMYTGGRNGVIHIHTYKVCLNYIYI